MRAWMTLVALSSRCSVTLVVLCQSEQGRSSEMLPRVISLCSKVIVRTKREDGSRSFASLSRRLPYVLSKIVQALHPIPLESTWVPASWIREVRQALGDQRYTSVHAYKLSMARPARALTPTNRSVLDLDDLESKAALRYAKIDRATSGRLLKIFRTVDGVKLRIFENIVSRGFDLVTVCSEVDKVELSARIGGKVRVVPNCVELPMKRKPYVHGRSRNVLFVGSLDYGPNQDAFRWICREIKADVHRVCGSDVAFRIVGRRPFAGAAEMAQQSGIELFTDVPDLVEHYLWADVVIVPVRSGGGTRIKILEALSFGVPVISTTLGAEGLELLDGEEYLVADSSAGFAQSVTMMFQNPDLGRKLSDNGFAKVLSRYSYQSSEKLICGLHDA